MAGGVEEKDEVIDIHLLQTLLYHVDCLEMDWIFLCVDLIMTFLTYRLFLVIWILPFFNSRNNVNRCRKMQICANDVKHFAFVISGIYAYILLMRWLAPV